MWEGRDVYRFAGYLDFQPTRSSFISMEANILSYYSAYYIQPVIIQPVQSTAQPSSIFLEVWSHVFAYMTSYHLYTHVRLFPRILALRLAFEHLIYSLWLFCVKFESKQIDSLEITEHGICIHSCISCITCIHNRYSELGISCSDLVFSFESDLTNHCCVLRGQFWNNFVGIWLRWKFRWGISWWICKLRLMIRNCWERNSTSWRLKWAWLWKS